MLHTILLHKHHSRNKEITDREIHTYFLLKRSQKVKFPGPKNANRFPWSIRSNRGRACNSKRSESARGRHGAMRLMWGTHRPLELVSLNFTRVHRNFSNRIMITCSWSRCFGTQFYLTSAWINLQNKLSELRRNYLMKVRSYQYHWVSIECTLHSSSKRIFDEPKYYCHVTCHLYPSRPMCFYN